VNRSREEWDGYFADALNALLSTDSERIKEVTEEEAKTIVESAARIADAALEKIEERFKGL
jgi:vacuolar-type H+-ATPase subunit E/Vma4